MSRYFLIANSKTINIKYLTDNVNESDIIMQFNTQKHFEKLKNLKCKHYICLNDTYNELWGHAVFEKNSSCFDYLYLRESCKTKPYFSTITTFPGKTKYIDNQICTEYVSSLSPSIGFLTLTYLLKNNIPKEHIVLIGFTFTGWSGHNWNFEKIFCKKHFTII
jgi:hypothetical protein